MDLVIESNVSTIRALEPVSKLIEETIDEDKVKTLLDISLDGLTPFFFLLFSKIFFFK